MTWVIVAISAPHNSGYVTVFTSILSGGSIISLDPSKNLHTRSIHANRTIGRNEADAFLSICVFAALSDGEKSDAERAEMQRIAEMLDAESAAPVIQQVLMGKLPLAEVAAALTSPNDRSLAYELALGVCETDGATSDTERNFLEHLRGLLSLDASKTSAIESEVSAVALAVPASVVPATAPAVNRPDNQKTILNYSILNGALELLPESLATMAILPLQMKMVYRIGKSHGFELDSGHIKEFVATFGLGMASQLVEGFARKFARGAMKKIGGKLAGQVADQAAGSAMSFASTYAIGMVADRYYVGNRKLSTSELQSGFSSLKDQAGALYAQHRSSIEAKSQTLNAASIFELVKPGAKVPV